LIRPCRRFRLRSYTLRKRAWSLFHCTLTLSNAAFTRWRAHLRSEKVAEPFRLVPQSERFQGKDSRNQERPKRKMRVKLAGPLWKMSVHAVIAPPGLQKSVSMSAKSGSHLRLGVQSEIFLTSPFVIPCLRFLVRNFFGLGMARLISPDQFPFRLQPIFEVVTE
jgi:hypothetical protein